MLKKTIVLGMALAAGPSLAAQIHPHDLLWGDLPAGSIGSDAHLSRDIVLADFDGDGDLDTLVANLDQENLLYVNDGSGSMSGHPAAPLTTDISNSRGIAVGDIDGDGDLDVFIANSIGQTNDLYLNLGTNPPSFSKVVVGAVVTDVGNSRQAEFADFDGDDDLDLYVTNFNDQANFLYINQGGTQGGTEGTFARHLSGDAATDIESSYGLAIGDVDGDEDLDIHVANHSGVVGGVGAANWLYLNDGSGTFTKSALGLQSVDIQNTLACSFADADADGDLDLFVGNGTAQTNHLFLNDGSGVFSARKLSALTMDRGRTIGSVWGDFDKDGDMDAILANRSPNITSELFVNIGGGNFVRQSFGPLSDNVIDTYDVASGDMNGDTFDDLILANYGAVNMQYSNHGGQWADLGHPLKGSMALPVMLGQGNCLAGTDLKLRVTNVPDNNFAYLVVGSNIQLNVFYGGVLVIDPLAILRILGAPNTGLANLVDFTATVPGSGLPSYVDLAFQAWIQDVGAPQGYSATNGLRVTTP